MLKTTLALAVVGTLIGYLVLRAYRRSRRVAEWKYDDNPAVPGALVLKTLGEAESKGAEATTIRHDAFATCWACLVRPAELSSKSYRRWRHAKWIDTEKPNEVKHVFTDLEMHQQRVKAEVNRDIQVDFFLTEADAWR